MAEYRIDPLTMREILKSYREIVGMSPKEGTFSAFKEIIDLFGEQARDECDHTTSRGDLHGLVSIGRR